MEGQDLDSAAGLLRPAPLREGGGSREGLVRVLEEEPFCATRRAQDALRVQTLRLEIAGTRLGSTPWPALSDRGDLLVVMGRWARRGSLFRGTLFARYQIRARHCGREPGRAGPGDGRPGGARAASAHGVDGVQGGDPARERRLSASRTWGGRG
jgi:hypothetical protein